MTKKNQAAVALGRLGGRVKSPAKKAAAQANIRKRWTPRYCEMCDERVRAKACPACGMPTQPMPEETPSL